MVQITLELNSKRKLHPIDLREITPEKLDKKNMEQISETPIWIGNRRSTISEIFSVSIDENLSEGTSSIMINGDVSNSRRIGYRMKSGEIIINGDAGFYLGSEMNGGQITVKGNVGEWAGIGMKNGLIEIEKDAGNFLGSAYRGTRKGMKGGVIIVKGNTGCESGAWMHGGTIKILGNANILPGIHMVNGTIYIGKNCPSRAGASMTGGKVIIYGKTNEVLPGFQLEEIKNKVKVEGEKIVGPFYSFSGDNAEGGKGKLLINATNNKHLSMFEDYL